MTSPPARRAKIVCTLGPATRSAESIAALIEAGMDVARLNLSHGTHDEHRAAYERVRSASDAAKRAVAVLADGLLRLEALAIDKRAVRCRVIEGGTVSDHQGINLPGVRVTAPPLTPKDLDDLKFALSLRVDMVALSFVRSPGDIEPVRAVMDEVSARLPVIAKIEKPEAVEQLDAVIRTFDGVMVARGDLGVEMPLER